MHIYNYVLHEYVHTYTLMFLCIVLIQLFEGLTCVSRLDFFNDICDFNFMKEAVFAMKGCIRFWQIKVFATAKSVKFLGPYKI